MGKRARGLLVTLGLFLFGSNAHAVPLSVCIVIPAGPDDNPPTTQICHLYESDESGNRSKVSSPLTSAVAPIFGADWAPRWVLVYGLTRKGVRKKQPSHVVLVTKPESSPFSGLFADTAILYTRGGKIFRGILKQALAAPLCVDNSETSACVLTIDKDANGVATFQQPFVWDSQNPASSVESFDTINVRTGPTPQLP